MLAPTPYPRAQFMLSVAQAEQFPPDVGSEVAIAGRSNAGKSSALNAITGRRALARASKSPGRTRLLNFFELAPGQRLVDLPGYGYAAAPRPDRTSWAGLIDALVARQTFRGLLLVVDARRGLTADDEELLTWAQAQGRPVHVLLSKCDLLERNRLRPQLAHCAAQLSQRATVQLFSARDGSGVVSARTQLATWLSQR